MRLDMTGDVLGQFVKLAAENMQAGREFGVSDAELLQEERNLADDIKAKEAGIEKSRKRYEELNAKLDETLALRDEHSELSDSIERLKAELEDKTRREAEICAALREATDLIPEHSELADSIEEGEAELADLKLKSENVHREWIRRHPAVVEPDGTGLDNGKPAAERYAEQAREWGEMAKAFAALAIRLAAEA